MASTTLANWNWSSQHVHSEVVDGEHISAESALILAAPPRLSQLSINEIQTSAGTQTDEEIKGSKATDKAQSYSTLVPIGILQDFTMGQLKPQQEVFEIGSRLRYFVDGRMRANFSVNRVAYFGPSLMRLMYAYAPKNKIDSFAHQLNENSPSDTGFPDFPDISTFDRPGYGNATKWTADFDPNGNNNNRDFWINLLSLVFNQPTGFVVVLKSANNKPYGSFYMENVKIENHGLNISSGAVLISEVLNGVFSRVVPIKVQSLGEGATQG